MKMLETNRLIFKHWKDCDISFSYQLWGNEDVVKYIGMHQEDIEPRYQLEIKNDDMHHVSYWPIFLKETNEFIGCCGLRPFQKNVYELGFHLLPQYWHQGYGHETANQVIDYEFDTLHAQKIIAGHHPDNHASKELLERLGFSYIGKNYYEPTGLYHDSYELNCF